MKLNTDKCHLLVSETKYEHNWEKIDNDKLLGVATDNNLANICFKGFQRSSKVSVLSRLASFLTVDKKRIIFKAFFESQFKYCPLTYYCPFNLALGLTRK